MKRRGWIARRRPMKRARKTLRPNRARKTREFARCYESAERVAWVQSLPSVVSGERPSVNAHVIGDGAGRKADARWIVPLTDAEHRTLHRIGKDSFEARYSCDLDALAMATEAAWRARTSSDRSTAA